MAQERSSRTAPTAETQPAGTGQDLGRHRRAIVRFLRVLGCEPSTSEDLAQETLLRSWQSDGPRAHASTRPWLIRIAKNLFVDRHRKRASGTQPAMEDWSERAEEAVLRAWGKDGGDRWIAAARECTAGLPERTQAIVRMFYSEGRSREQIAQALGMRENGVKTSLQRARQALRRCIEAKTQ